MPGANYMGGKRIHAKARSRNSALRAQSNHFGKRRFEILSKGLGGNQVLSNNSGVSLITLSHASRDQSPPDREREQSPPTTIRTHTRRATF
ncbi:hypothetical protein BV25DRAFT_1987637, partial [Artomyces pyxidatus]